MTYSERFKSLISTIKIDNAKDLETMSLLDYVKLNIESNEYFYFSDEYMFPASYLNEAFIDFTVKYVKES